LLVDKVITKVGGKTQGRAEEIRKVTTEAESWEEQGTGPVKMDAGREGEGRDPKRHKR